MSGCCCPCCREAAHGASAPATAGGGALRGARGRAGGVAGVLADGARTAYASAGQFWKRRRRIDEFQRFLMALSVRPGSVLAISAHRFPRIACAWGGSEGRHQGLPRRSSPEPRLSVPGLGGTAQHAQMPWVENETGGSPPSCSAGGGRATCRRRLSSHSDHDSFEISGSRWLCQRSLHCLPRRPGSSAAIRAHCLVPHLATAAVTFSSSCSWFLTKMSARLD